MMDDILIRSYTDSDWESICQVHDAARWQELTLANLSDAYLKLEDTYENEGLFDGKVMVAEIDGKVAGFVAHKEDEITWLYVHPSCMGKGIGRQLLTEAMDRCNSVIITEALSGNLPAIKLYESVGFVTIEVESGKLAGNEGFSASGHIMEYRRQ